MSADRHCHLWLLLGWGCAPLPSDRDPDPDPIATTVDSTLPVGDTGDVTDTDASHTGDTGVPTTEPGSDWVPAYLDVYAEFGWDAAGGRLVSVLHEGEVRAPRIELTFGDYEWWYSSGYGGHSCAVVLPLTDASRAPWVDGAEVWFGVAYTGGATTDCPATVVAWAETDDFVGTVLGDPTQWGVGLGPNGALWEELAVGGDAREVGIQAFVPNDGWLDLPIGDGTTEDRFWAFPIRVDPVTFEASTIRGGTEWDALTRDEVWSGTELQTGYYQMYPYFWVTFE
ncbi:MAG: hypothetical protein ABMB14_03860 [Myxococcota bacterium]